MSVNDDIHSETQQNPLRSSREDELYVYEPPPLEDECDCDGEVEEEDYGAFEAPLINSMPSFSPSPPPAIDSDSSDSALEYSKRSLAREWFGQTSPALERACTTFWKTWRDEQAMKKEKKIDFVVPPILRESLSQVLELVTKYFTDVSSTSLLLGLVLLRTHYKTKTAQQAILPSGTPFTDTELLADMTQAMKYSNATYGWRLIVGFFEAREKSKTEALKSILANMVEGDIDANLKVFTSHTGIPISDLLHWQWVSNFFNPGHYLAVDRSHNTIVVALRGTFHTKDALTDLVANPALFFFAGVSGFTHTGILKCSANKFAILDPHITAAVEKFPGFRVLVVGHSLGGGVAQLLTLMLATAHPEWPLTCYAFGSALVLSHNLATSPAVKKLITTVIYNNDVTGSLKALKLSIQQILKASEGKIVRGVAEKAVKSAVPEKIGKRLKCKPLFDDSFIHSGFESFPNETLLPGGRVLFCWVSNQKDPTTGKIQKRLLIEERTPESFGTILISDSMFTDHMPTIYMRKYEKVTKKLREERLHFTVL